MGKWCLHASSFIFYRIIIKVAGNQERHKISDDFEFRPDWTTDYGVSCPWVSKKFPIHLKWENGVAVLARSFFIKSSSKLLVTRTGIKVQSSSILGQIRPLILELLALEWRKFHTFELEYLWSQLASLDQILCVASLGWGKGCIRFLGRLTLAHWTQVRDRCPLGYLFHQKNTKSSVFTSGYQNTSYRVHEWNKIRPCIERIRFSVSVMLFSFFYLQ